MRHVSYIGQALPGAVFDWEQLGYEGGPCRMWLGLRCCIAELRG